MRILVQFTFPSAVGNEVVRSGRIEKFFQNIAEDLEPEAMYFFPADGERSGVMVIQTDDAAIAASVGERFWFGLQAKVKLTPCMNADDLANGMAELPGILESYG